MTVRLAKLADVSAILYLSNEWHPEKDNALREQNLRVILTENKPGHVIFVAEKESKVIGWFDVKVYDDWFMLRHCVHIEHMCVGKKWQKQGTGSEILQSVVKTYKVTPLHLKTTFYYSEGGVNRFFVKNGFVYNPQTRFFIREE